MGPFVDRGGWIGGLGVVVVGTDRVVVQEVVAPETGVALPTLRIEDPQRRPTPRRAISIARDKRFRPLPDDVATEPDPRPPREFEAETGRLGDGRCQGPGRSPCRSGRLEHDEQRLRAPGEGRQPAKPVGDVGRSIRGGQASAGQVQDEQVHRAPGQQGATDGQALVEGLRRDDDEPLEPDAASDGLDRIETAREIQPGHDRTGSLGLRGKSQDEGRPAARPVAPDRDAGRARQTARAKDRIERREPGGDDALVETGGRSLAGGRGRGRAWAREQGRGLGRG